MTKRFTLLHFALLSTLLAGCAGDDSPFTESSTVSDEPISDKNFNLFIDPIDPEVLTDEGFFGGVEVTLTVQAGDRFNSKVSSGIVYFETEWGILETNSCTISQGSCSVTWTSDSNFALIPPDLINTFTAYTEGEESYVDLNGSNSFDDADGTYIRDIAEPFLDINHDGDYTLSTDKVIDIDDNGIHTPGDNLFNGKKCEHTTLCSSTRSIIISDRIYMNMDQRTVP